jgi:hypothetical protein
MKTRLSAALLLALLLLIAISSLATASFTVTINTANKTTFTPPAALNFNYTVVGTNASYSCALYVNNVLRASNTTTQNDTLTKIIPSSPGAGTYSYYINCTNDSIYYLKSSVMSATLAVQPYVPYADKYEWTDLITMGKDMVGVGFAAVMNKENLILTVVIGLIMFGLLFAIVMLVLGKGTHILETLASIPGRMKKAY